ncbi:hypothetical protein HG531_013923 [Fusarium graminearum]|nr:hypothetical protein HG531_013923 [Fusarium graminearum]
MQCMKSASAPLSVDIGALCVDISCDLNVEIKLGCAGGQVLEDGDVGVAISSLTNTKDNRRPVTSVLTLGAVPNTGVLDAVTLLVDIVLGRGAGAIPDIILVLGGVADGNGATSVGNSGDNHVLSSRVISSASDDILVEVVLDGDTTDTSIAESVVVIAGQFELAVLVTVETTNRLLISTLSRGPLGLLVTSRAGVGTHSTRSAAIALDSGVNLENTSGGKGEVRNVLDTRPATELEPVKGNGAVLGGEGVTVNLAALELLVNAGAAASEARGGAARLGLAGLGLTGLDGSGSRVHRLGSSGRGLGGRSFGGLGFVELGADLLLGSRSLLGLSSGGLRSSGGVVGRVRLANNDEVTSVQTSLGGVDVNFLASKLVDSLSGTDNVLGDNIRAALLDLGSSVTTSVDVLVVVVLGGSAGGERGRKGVSDDVLHGKGI